VEHSQLELGSIPGRLSRRYDQNMVCQDVIVTDVEVGVWSLLEALESVFDGLEWNQRNLPLEKSLELIEL